MSMMNNLFQVAGPTSKRRVQGVVRVFAGAMCLVSLSAFAQWTWMDKDGRKVYSDKAPPPDVLEKNVIKRPGGQIKGSPANTEQSATANAKTKGADTLGSGAPAGTASAETPDGMPPVINAPTSSGAASVPKLTGLEKELELKKKQAADALAAKRAEEEQKSAKIKADNCARAKTAKVTLDSGARVGVTNAKGEREIMDDAARIVESKRVQGMIDVSCK